MEDSQTLGRLIRTLKNEKCSNCGNVMQLRGRKDIRIERGVEIHIENEYKFCPSCGEEIEIRHRDIKKRLDYVDKTAWVKPVEEKRGENAKYNKSTRPATSYDNSSRGSVTRNNGRSS